MIISFFSTGTGGGAAPVDYLMAREVLAYDESRNLIRDDSGQPQTKIRNPLPEVLHGNPDQTRDLIDASPNKWSYTAGVISFADSDDPSPDAQQEAIAVIVLTVPLFLPVMQQIGVDPVQFGVIMIMCSMLGLLTPPVGMVLFAVASVARMPVGRLSRALVPYLIGLALVLVLVVSVPGVSTWLPNLVMGP